MTRPVYSCEFVVPKSAVDENGHTNDVMYMQWMQSAAVRHYAAMRERIREKVRLP